MITYDRVIRGRYLLVSAGRLNGGIADAKLGAGEWGILWRLSVNGYGASFAFVNERTALTIAGILPRPDAP